jgi:hypothetical protein
MPWGWLSPRGRVLSRVGIGALSQVITPGLVDAAVGDGLAWEMRLRELPSRLGVYFVLGLCLFSGLPYVQVLRELTRGLRAPLAAAGWADPSPTALTGVRRRVGERPLESVFRRVAGAFCPGRAPWSHLGGLLLAAWDGTVISAADSEANTAAFGKPGAGKKRAGKDGREPAHARACVFPQMRLVTLAACGTRCLLDAAAGPVRGKGTGERDLARRLLGSLRPGMLLLADRGFYSWQLWKDAAATRADLLWRARDDMRLPAARELPDGSWLCRVADPAAAAARHRKNRQRAARGSRLPPQAGPLPAVTVRVIEFRVTVTCDDGTARTSRYRLVTTLLDHRAFPAAQLAACYARRWAIETGYRELKDFLRGPGRALRGRTPDLARQELWAYLAVYQAIRIIIARAAARDGLDPARISFTAALHAARRTAAAPGTAAALDAAESEILAPAALVPHRPGRLCTRAVKRRTAVYPARTSNSTRHASYTVTITTPATAARTTNSQPKHPKTPATQPP